MQTAAAEPRTVPPLPTALWTDEPLRDTTEGHSVWVDPARGRTIHASWATPRDQAALGLVLFFPALGQASITADPLIRMLAGAGYAVVVLGEPSPIDLRLAGPVPRASEQGAPASGTPEERQGAGSAARGDDPATAAGRPALVSRDRSTARAAFSIAIATERALDARFALGQLELAPPFQIGAEARNRVAIVGLELGAQTAQLLIGEQMQRQTAAAPDSRVRAAVLLAPFSSFEGPGFSQRYRSITVPLLVVFGSLESDSHGLGITAAQRRQMAKAIDAPLYAVELNGASVTELFVRRGIFAPGDSAPRARAPMGDVPSGGNAGARPTTLAEEVGKGPRFVSTEAAPAQSRAPPAAMRTTLLATRAFLDAVLLGDADAREWLERNSGAGARTQAGRSN
ncbi:MAG: hypothetical protein ACREBN_10410 [Burkholderiaceae bacterium]